MKSLYDVWLTTSPDQDFSAGVQLITQYAPGAVTAKILSRLRSIALSGAEPGEYELGKLDAALRDTPAPPVIRIASEAPVLPMFGNPAWLASVVHIASDAPALTTIRMAKNQTGAGDWRQGIEVAKPLHKAHSHHHALMVSATSDEQRADHARKIMEDILPKIDRIYDGARAGEAVEENTDKEPPVGNPLRRLQSLRTRVSRLRNQLIPGASNSTRRAALEAELKQKLVEIEALEAQV